jgi:glycosyltransferase involved in cell wall biosynthesis
VAECTEFYQPIIITTGTEFTNSKNAELLDRHSRYGRAFQKVTGDPEALLTVLVPALSPYGSVIAEREALKVISIGPRRGLLSVGLCAGLWARQQGLNPFWIAGTPFKEALAGCIARILLKGPFQIQSHGNFGALSLRRGPASDRARWLTAKLTLPRADSLRTVSPEQQSRLLSTFRLDPAISFVAPVPVNPVFFENRKDSSTGDHILRLGWFGRLHRERGFDEWLERAVPEVQGRDSVTICVIGDGPHKDEFQARIKELLPSTEVVWYGNLVGQALVDAVASLDILINSFRNETFGRAMLEAILLGVHILAVDSPGSRYLVALLTRDIDLEQPISQVQILNDWHHLQIPKHHAVSIVKEFELNSVRSLAESWCLTKTGRL